MKRKIIRIDEELCNGCGQCVTACAEGALAIVDGKAKLVNDVFCDGLGACIGDCPTGALVIEEREAEAFDENAVHVNLHSRFDHAQSSGCTSFSCPGTFARNLQSKDAPPVIMTTPESTATEIPVSNLGNWPVQLKLVPPTAPYLQGARILVCADCVPYAVPDFHQRYLKGRVVMTGCPKLDDIAYYLDKLTSIFRISDPSAITVLRMEVPCCSGIAAATVRARDDAGLDIPVDVHTIGIDGTINPERIPVRIPADD